MIKAEELRVGNIIGRYYWNPSPTGKTKEIDPCVVKEIREESLNVEIKIGRKERAKAGYESFTGIPLTEDWLLKFGFVYDGLEDSYDDNNWYHFKHGDFKFSSDLSTEFSMVFVSFKKATITSVKYVHQLQNIFHSLTGQEITFKEK